MDYSWHLGEQAIHKRLGLTQVNVGNDQVILSSMPLQHSTLFTTLPYLPVSTLDANSRPWASILCGPPGFIYPASPNHLALSTKISQGDPILENLHANRLLAGLGIDLATRRRNKVFGRIEEGMLKINGKQLQVIVTTEQSLGNCPKYINVRRLEFKEQKVGAVSSNMTKFEGLPDEAIAHIRAADTAFLATHHSQSSSDLVDKEDLDVNYRGGRKGFIRISPTDPKTLYLPDYSGNRLFQSLGNIEHDPFAGLTIPDFVTGDILYLTGSASNIVGDECEVLMPGVKRCTRITVDEWIWVKKGINLNLKDEKDEVGYSPYNPPLFLLAAEMKFPLSRIKSEDAVRATLIKITPITKRIATFTWSLSKPLAWKPGQHAIFDFSKEVVQEYSHMKDSQPQSLNDTNIRSWTISSPAPLNIGESIDKGTDTEQEKLGAKKDILETTIRWISTGEITPLLHRARVGELCVPLLGIDGNFIVDLEVPRTFGRVGNGTNGSTEHAKMKDEKTSDMLKTKKILFVAGGIGITPFMAMLRSLPPHSELSITPVSAPRLDIVVFFTLKEADSVLVETLPSHPYISKTENFIGRRINKENLLAVPDLEEREVFACGPSGLISKIEEWLPNHSVRVEQFYY